MINLVEGRLRESEDRISQIKQQNTEVAKKSRLMLAHHIWEHPSKLKLKIKSSLAYRGAQLLSAYDEATRNTILLYRIGVYSAAECAERLRVAAKFVLQPFQSRRALAMYMENASHQIMTLSNSVALNSGGRSNFSGPENILSLEISIA